MINLIPPEEHRQLTAARTNSLLLRYSVLLGVFICVILIELLGMYFVINLGKTQNESIISDNQAKVQQYMPIQQKANTFTTNLSTAKYILGRQAPYTNIILALANKLPSGAVFDALTIDPATFGTPTTLTVMTTSYDKSIEVKSALQDVKINGSTPLFTSVSFTSVSQQDGNKSYPYTATYSVTYSKEAAKS